MLMPVRIVTAIASIAVVALCYAAYKGVDRWLHPPPPTVTVHEIEAASERAKRQAAEESLRRAQEVAAERARTIEQLQTQAKEADDRASALYAQTVDPDGVCLPADDPWLLDWRKSDADGNSN